jgi:hypothetical protein
MSKPTDQQLLKRNAHISDEEIRQDIADTQREIDDLSRQQSYRRTGVFNRKDRIENMKIQAIGTRVTERKAFVADLEHLLELRQKAGGL